MGRIWNKILACIKILDLQLKIISKLILCISNQAIFKLAKLYTRVIKTDIWGPK